MTDNPLILKQDASGIALPLRCIRMPLVQHGAVDSSETFTGKELSHRHYRAYHHRDAWATILLTHEWLADREPVCRKGCLSFKELFGEKVFDVDTWQ